MSQRVPDLLLLSALLVLLVACGVAMNEARVNHIDYSGVKGRECTCPSVPNN